MNNKPSSTKSTITILVVIALAGLGYFWWSGNNTPSSSSISGTDASQAAVGVQVLNLLNQIQSLNIDTSLFSDPAFRTLVDYSVTIPPVNVGRPNPFAPIPGFKSTTP
jgi:hypothetical protein